MYHEEKAEREWAEREKSLAAMTEILLEGECNPHDVDVFLEAIHDECLASSRDVLAEAIEQGRSGHELIGAVIWKTVYNYCANRAEMLANERVS